MPYEIFKKKQKNKIEEDDDNQQLGDLKIGDKVRVMVQKTTFDKGDVIQFSKDIFTISGRDGQRYELINEDDEKVRRKFKYYELQKVGKVKEIPDDIEEQEHLENKKVKKIQKEIKKVGIELDNITTTKRIKKAINKGDYEYY